MTKSEDPRSISEAEARRVLSILCIKYGFCLSPLWTARLEKNPPNSVGKFTDTVFHAEGMDPTMCETSLYNSVRGEVQVAFDRS